MARTERTEGKKKKQFTDKTSFFNYNDKYTSLPQKDTSQHSKSTILSSRTMF